MSVFPSTDIVSSQAQYMCPITLDWFHNPVVVASGISYSRDAIEEHLGRSSLCPVTRMDLTNTPLYDFFFFNITLRNVVEHYRLHHQRFRILSSSEFNALREKEVHGSSWSHVMLDVMPSSFPSDGKHSPAFTWRRSTSTGLA